MTPRKRYVIINTGKAEAPIYNCLDEAATRVGQLQAFGYEAFYLAFKTRLAAEEFIAWWQGDRH